MKIDVSSLIDNEGQRLEFNGEVTLELVTLGCNTFEFKKPVEVKAVFTSLGNAIELDASVSGVVATQCARCTCDVDMPFDFSFNELLKKIDYINQDVDAIAFLGSVVELDSIISDNFALNSPIKVLCSEECIGLCPQCGTDLNKEVCSCKNQTVDPRFSVLDKLFSDNSSFEDN